MMTAKNHTPKTLKVEPIPDFIYKDIHRLTSYASTFATEGVLMRSIERMHSKRGMKGSASFSAGIAKLKGELGGESAVEYTQEFDPFDQLVLSVIDELGRGGFIHEDLDKTPIGGFVFLKGKLTLTDNTAMSTLSDVLQSGDTSDWGTIVAGEMAEDGQGAVDPNAASFALNIFRGLLGGFQLPTAFNLHTVQDELIGGPIKEEFLMDPIATYNYRHGTDGISNVWVLAIKESNIPTQTTALSPPTMEKVSDISEAGPYIKELLSSSLFENTVKATPVAIFRELLPSK